MNHHGVFLTQFLGAKCGNLSLGSRWRVKKGGRIPILYSLELVGLGRTWVELGELILRGYSLDCLLRNTGLGDDQTGKSLHTS